MISVADPGFPRRGASTPEFGAKTYYLPRFLTKTVKMKETGRRVGGRASLVPLPLFDPLLDMHSFCFQLSCCKFQLHPKGQLFTICKQTTSRSFTVFCHYSDSNHKRILILICHCFIGCAWLQDIFVNFGNFCIFNRLFSYCSPIV